MKRPLPPELIALGDTLQLAVERTIVQRRRRRTAFFNGVASIAVALPLALSVAFADLSDAPRSSVGQGGARAALTWTPGFPLAVAHIHDETVRRTRAKVVCLDANDCRVPIPFYLDSPLGKV